MITFKLYVPLHDNDGDRMLNVHEWLIDKLTTCNTHESNQEINGFTTYDAKGYWMSGGKRYIDENRIYEFHIDEDARTSVEYYLKIIAQRLCSSLKQECIYMTIDGEQHFIGSED